MSSTDDGVRPGGPGGDDASTVSALVRIRAALPGLRPSERRIAQFFLDSPDEAGELSIADVARACDTSTTSVVRFTKQLGYEHLRELRADVLRAAVSETLQASEVPEVSGDIGQHDTLEQVVANVSSNEIGSLADTAQALDVTALAASVELVAGADRVDIFGLGASSFVALDLQQKLVRIGRTALNWPDPHGAWTSAATLTPDAVAVAISHSGATHDTVEYLSIAGSTGARTIAITNDATSPLAQRADVVLTTVARETPFRAGALGSRMAQLLVVDCLFIGVAQAHYDRSLEAIRLTYAAVHGRRARR